jgi:hypothetical protein
MATASSSFIKTSVEPELLAGFRAFARRHDLTPSVALRLVAHHAMVQAGFTPDEYDPDTERRGDFQVWERRRKKAIAEDDVQLVLIARVKPGFKDAFAQFASSLGRSSPATLKAVVEHVVTAARIEPAELEVPSAPVVRSERVTVRFSKQELAHIESRAKDFPTVRDWLVALARAQIVPDVPQFSPEALRILYESNRELSAIGRNVNQIAHAVNLDLQQAGELRGSRALVDELAGLRAMILVHTERVTALCAASSARWSHV